MSDNDKLSSGVTPISSGMDYQKDNTSRKYTEKTLDKKNLKDYQIELNGRTIAIKYGKEGVYIDGKLYKTTVEEVEENTFVASVTSGRSAEHQYKIIHQEGTIYLEGREVEFSFKAGIPKLKRADQK